MRLLLALFAPQPQLFLRLGFRVLQAFEKVQQMRRRAFVDDAVVIAAELCADQRVVVLSLCLGGLFRLRRLVRRAFSHFVSVPSFS